MAYYKTCPSCGAHLDPGEICDCLSEKKKPHCSAGRFKKLYQYAIIVS